MHRSLSKKISAKGRREGYRSSPWRWWKKRKNFCSIGFTVCPAPSPYWPRLHARGWGDISLGRQIASPLDSLYVPAPLSPLPFLSSSPFPPIRRGENTPLDDPLLYKQILTTFPRLCARVERAFRMCRTCLSFLCPIVDRSCSDPSHHFVHSARSLPVGGIRSINLFRRI